QENPLEFNGVSNNLFVDLGDTQVSYRDLAKKYVYKWYRIRTDIDSIDQRAPLRLPGFGRIDYLEQILPIEDELVETTIENARTVNKKANISGVFWNGGNNMQNTAAGTFYTRPYRILKDSGIVEFANPVVKMQQIGNAAQTRWLPAVIYLFTATS